MSGMYDVMLEKQRQQDLLNLDYDNSSAGAAAGGGGEGAGGGGGIGYGAIGSIAGGVFNSLPNWYGLQHKKNSANINRAVYGDSTQDPIARILSGHGSDMAAASREIQGQTVDFSGVKNNENLLNAWDANDLQNGVNYEFGWSNIADNLTASGKGAAAGMSIGGPWGALIGGIAGGVLNIASQLGGESRANKLNRLSNMANDNTVNSYYSTAQRNQARSQRQALMNYFAEGGDLNGVTKFNTGGSHEQNPFGGIPQGIASDGEPNFVEEGEVKYKDYIFSNRFKVTKSMLSKYNLPEKYAGQSFAFVADKLQKESEERPNDPISISTLETNMSRLQEAQEEHRSRRAVSEANKIFDSLSAEEKAGIMMAAGGKIHIDPSKKGTFTAAATKHGMSVQEFASRVLSNPDSYSPAMRKKANFAKNASKWHDGGGHLFLWGGDPTKYEFAQQYETIAPEEHEALPLQIVTNWDEVRDPNRFWGSQQELDDYYRTWMTNRFKSIKGTKYNEAELPHYYLNANETTAAISDLMNSSDPKERALGNMLQNQWVINGNNMRESDVYLAWAGDNPARTDHLNGVEHSPKLAPEYTKVAPSYATSTYQSPDYSGPETAKVSSETGTKGGTSEAKGASLPPVGGSKTNLLRYAPVIGSGVGALVSTLMGPDYTYADKLRELAGKYNPISAPALSGYRRYNPYDINLANAEAMAQQASLQRANRATANRATQAANAIALENAYERAAAARNLQWQQANEANRAAVDQYNLGIDKANSDIVQAYDRINQDIRDRRIRMLQASAAAQDAADTAWSQNVSNNTTNFFNQLGNLGKDQWSADQLMTLIKNYPELLG